MTSPAPPPGILVSRPPRRSWALPLLGGLFVAPHILLPLDWGFPRLPILGHPLNPAAAFSIALFGMLVLRSRGAILEELRRPYCMLQSAYFVVLILASLRAASPLVALQLSLVYFCVFVLNYVSLLHLIQNGGARTFVLAVAVVGLAAAAVGVLQGIFGVRFGAYEAWYAQYFQSSAADPLAAGSRGIGTLNNPILYGMAMVLLVPYVLEIRRIWLRLAVFTVLFVAAVLTGSRTVLLVGAVFLAGGILVYRWRALWLVPVLLCGLIAGVQSLGGWKQASEDPRVRFLVARVGLGGDELGASARGNIAIRQEALRQGAREVLDNWGPGTWLAGKGMLTAAAIGQKVSADYSTVDNAFFGIFYEKGLIGAALFLWSFASLLRSTRSVARRTLHWWAPIGLLASGLAFNFDAFSTFNILAVGSMAVITTLGESHVARRQGS